MDIRAYLLEAQMPEMVASCRVQPGPATMTYAVFDIQGQVRRIERKTESRVAKSRCRYPGHTEKREPWIEISPDVLVLTFHRVAKRTKREASESHWFTFGCRSKFLGL